MAHRCNICNGTAELVGAVKGILSSSDYILLRCTNCRFAFISNPRTDYVNIYNEAYYNGTGVDPMVDYIRELNFPQLVVRQYEWNGIIEVIHGLFNVDKQTRWLDFGCGNGGLVRQGRALGLNVSGFEVSWIAQSARSLGIPILSAEELEHCEGMFDIVSAVEVLEHLTDPLEELRRMRRLLKPSGLLFCTTGNARPFRDSLLRWGYAKLPEVHVGFYEPATLAQALSRAGFAPEWPGYVNGYSDIIRFKILKNLGVRNVNLYEQMMPWRVISRLADEKYEISRLPVGRAI